LSHKDEEFEYHYYRPVSGDRKGKKDDRNLYDRIWKEGLKKGVSGYGDLELTRLFFDKLDIDKGSLILEIGCGIGSFLNSIYVTGYKNTVGVDISKYAVDAGKEKHPHLDLRCMDANVLKFKGDPFDICFSFDLVEHLEYIDRHFRNVWKILKRGGKYTFQTPNKITNVPVSIIRDRNLVGWKVYHPSLQFSWGLKKRLSRAGFRKIIFIKIPPLSKYKIYQIPKPFRWVFKIIPWKWLPLFLQVNFFVVAIK
jgi:2-polyprenyl-3-methyl-5-hydroxy-6-metoxy-1,4-benzoquinol methylase